MTKDATEAQTLRAQAIDLFAKIVEDKRRGDTGAQMLADEYDPDLRLRSCVASPEQVGSPDMRYQAATSLHKVGPLCERPEVIAVVQGADLKKDRFRLRVWGSGIDTAIAVDESGRVVRLDPLPENTTRYYFARLEDAEGTPLSTPVAIRTLRKNGKCANKNSRIPIVFTVRPATVPEQVRRTAT